MSRPLLWSVLCWAVVLGCTSPPPQQADFTSWANQLEPAPTGNSDQSLLAVPSQTLKVDQLFRSMVGPYTVLPFSFSEVDDDLVWLRGYDVAEWNEDASAYAHGFLCHNNINIVDKGALPWVSKTLGSKTRLFTLTEGQTKVMLPEGFGVPLPANTELEVVAQVLNHNHPDTSLQLQQHAQLHYSVSSGPELPLVPLYQQGVFVTKQTGGPDGEYGQSPLQPSAMDSALIALETLDIAQCQPNYAGADYNPFADGYGRTYTGHWTLPQGQEILRTNVTPMLNLQQDNRIHFIGVHVHPFARELTLRDRTADSTLFTANITNFKDRIGLASVPYYSSTTGIPVYADHEYELVSTYDSPVADQHTAMATMFLYLRDE